MTRDLAALRLLAWQTFDCDSCSQTINHRCRTASGNLTTPHAPRMALAAGWDARQGEVDELQRALDVSNATVTVLADGLQEQAAKVTALVAERDESNALAVSLAAQLKTARLGAALVPGLQQQVADLLAKIAVLEKPPVVEPPVPSTAKRTLFGACPRKGDTPQGVVTRWGKGAAVRIFGATSAVARPTDAGIVHVSWKPTLAQITDAWVTTVTKALKPGDCVEVWHEADKKVTDKTLTYADAVARKNTFYDAVKRVRPDLLVVNTLTGWLLDPKSGGDVERWAAVKADVLGVDCDGVRPTKLPYVSYVDETKTALAFLEKHSSYRWFSVPEFGCPRIPTEDVDGSKRAAWHAQYAQLWADSGKCLAITLYEYDSSPNYALTTSAELEQWKALAAR